MINIFVICDYCVQRFYFLNVERQAVLSDVISNVQIRKNIAFKKGFSNIKLANMGLSQQQLAGKLVKIKETPQKMLNIKTEVENQTQILIKEIHQKRKSQSLVIQ